MCFRNGHYLCTVLFSQKDRKGHNVQNAESLLWITQKLPYDCIKDTSKITHSIMHEHKYTYIVRHRVLYHWVWRAHTNLKQSTLPVTHISTCTHRSSIFQQVRKVQLIKFNPADKIPTHKHLYSNQYYHINSIAKPHSENIRANGPGWWTQKPDDEKEKRLSPACCVCAHAKEPTAAGKTLSMKTPPALQIN